MDLKMDVSTINRMQQFTLLLNIFLLSTTYAELDYDNIKDDINFSQENFPEFKQYGQKTSLLNSLNEQKPLVVSLGLNHNLEHTFEHNLISPQIPDVLPSIKSTLRYTDTPTDTYEVTEDVFEPKPIPVSIAKPILGAKSPLILGSGSLGFAKLKNGKYALGSGSLGYSRPVENNFVHALEIPKKEEAFGGLHVVPAPRLGSNEAFDAAFNNFDFKPLSDFFNEE